MTNPETAITAIETAQKGVVVKTVFGHLRENRIEYAVFTLLLYSLGLIDKALNYGTGLCV